MQYEAIPITMHNTEEKINSIYNTKNAILKNK